MSAAPRGSDLIVRGGALAFWGSPVDHNMKLGLKISFTYFIFCHHQNIIIWLSLYLRLENWISDSLRTLPPGIKKVNISVGF